MEIFMIHTMGELILKKRILRHVSDAFIEDPLRVLRVARFATLDEKFVIHKDTLNLLKKMVLNEELKSLAIERVVVEIKKGLEGKKIKQDVSLSVRMWCIKSNSSRY